MKDAECTKQAEMITRMQEIIDEFELKKFSNLHLYVNELNSQLERIITAKLTKELAKWMRAFEQWDKNQQYILAPLKHELRYQDKKIVLSPPLEYSRFFWFQELHA